MSPAPPCTPPSTSGMARLMMGAGYIGTTPLCRTETGGAKTPAEASARARRPRSPYYPARGLARRATTRHTGRLARGGRRRRRALVVGPEGQRRASRQPGRNRRPHRPGGAERRQRTSRHLVAPRAVRRPLARDGARRPQIPPALRHHPAIWRQRAEAEEGGRRARRKYVGSGVPGSTRERPCVFPTSPSSTPAACRPSAKRIAEWRADRRRARRGGGRSCSRFTTTAATSSLCSALDSHLFWRRGLLSGVGPGELVHRSSKLKMGKLFRVRRPRLRRHPAVERRAGGR